MQTGVGEPGAWDPGKLCGIEDGELHVLSFGALGTSGASGTAGAFGEMSGTSGVPGPADERRWAARGGARMCGDGTEDGTRSLLADVLGRPRDEIALGRDGHGRLRVDGLSAGLYVCRDDGALAVAIAPGAEVALSGHPVPPALEGAALLPYTDAERRMADTVPRHRRSWFLTRLWVRKEAALRLASPGRLSLAAQVDALGRRNGEVLVPEPLPGGGHCPRRAYVVDLSDGDRGRVAAAATSLPMGSVRVWRARARLASCVTG